MPSLLQDPREVRELPRGCLGKGPLGRRSGRCRSPEVGGGQVPGVFEEPGRSLVWREGSAPAEQETPERWEADSAGPRSPQEDCVVTQSDL